MSSECVYLRGEGGTHWHFRLGFYPERVSLPLMGAVYLNHCSLMLRVYFIFGGKALKNFSFLNDTLFNYEYIIIMLNFNCKYGFL